MIYYNKYKIMHSNKDKIFLMNKKNLAEFTGRGRKKHAIIRDTLSLRFQNILNYFFLGDHESKCHTDTRYVNKKVIITVNSIISLIFKQLT